MIKGGLEKRMAVVGMLALSPLLAGCFGGSRVCDGKVGTQTVQVYHERTGFLNLGLFTDKYATRLDFIESTGLGSEAVSKVIHDAGSGRIGDEEGDYVEYLTSRGTIRYGFSTYTSSSGDEVPYSASKSNWGPSASRAVTGVGRQKLVEADKLYQGVMAQVPGYVARESETP